MPSRTGTPRTASGSLYLKTDIINIRLLAEYIFAFALIHLLLKPDIIYGYWHNTFAF